MTKNFDEYKSNKGRCDKFIKVMEVVLTIALVLLLLAFILMLLFPAWNGGGWLEFF